MLTLLDKIKSNDKMYIYKYIREEMSKIHSDEHRIANILVEYLYGRTNSSFKDTLWWTYGDILLYNLKNNLKGTKQCESCGERIEEYNTKKYCKQCAEKITREKKRLWKRKNSRKNEGC